MSNPSVRDVLIAARKLIEKPEDWFHHGYEEWNGRHCLVTAARLAAEKPNGLTDWDKCWAAKVALQAVIMDDLIDWNDHPGRTHAEVLRAFDKAIAECGQ